MVNTRTRAFGCPHRYIQGPGEFNNIEKYTRQLGEKVCFLIDGFLFDGLNDRLVKIYEDTASNFMAIKFEGECCEAEINRINQLSKAYGATVFVGVGGGKTMDTTKLCSDRQGLSFIIIPTAVSTDAPVSEIAVLYTEDGVYIGSEKIKKGSEIVIVDSEIIIGAPKRLFIAGIGDALATWFESQACQASDSANYVGTGYRSCLAGMAISKMCYDAILSDAVSALRALDRGVVTEAVENIIEANTLLSGLGFHNTGLSAAHGIHSGMTSFPSTHKYLHGEKVSFGIVFQMVLENRPTEEVDKIMKFMVEVGLPVTLEQIGIEATEENISNLAKKTDENALIHHEPFRVTEELVYAAIATADELGKSYLKK